MTKPPKAPKPPKPPKPKKPYAKTTLPGGDPKSPNGPVAKIIQICEDLRDRNTDGYIRKSRWLADVKNFGFGGRITAATVCSPFTGTVVGVAFDTVYPRDDKGGDPYVPKFNGNDTDLLPADFYTQHNDKDRPVGSLVDYNIGRKIDAKEMRRGDVLGIDWAGGGGHAVFCWDVHLNDKGEVDCFQMIGSHGSLSSNGYGVHIYGCWGEKWLKGKPAKYDQPGTGNLSKANPGTPIFVDDDEIVRKGTWFGLKGVKDKDIDRTTFRVTPITISAIGSKVKVSRVGELQVGRFHYEVDPPKPYCMVDGWTAGSGSRPVSEKSTTNKPASGAGAGSAGGGGGASASPAPAPAKPAPPPPKPADAPANTGPPPPPKPGHVEAAVTPVKKDAVKKDPEAIKKVPPKPAKQDPEKPLMLQRDVEIAMQEFFLAKWIASDPGIPDDVNDDKSQAAIREFQRKFHLKDDGIVGKNTKTMIEKQLPACHQQQLAEELLGELFKGGRLSKDPGAPNGVNDDESRAAVEEFQDLQGLEPTGIPDADTLAKLKQVVKDKSATESQHGLHPELEAVYWLGNRAPSGGAGHLRLHSRDLKIGHPVKVFLKPGEDGEEVESTEKLLVKADSSEASIPIPASFNLGAQVFARVVAEVGGGKTLEMKSAAPLYVAPAAAGGALEEFFKLNGSLGEKETPTPHVYVAYKVAGKPDAWFLMGRLMMDVDGAPNCYHPDDYKVNTHYWEYDIMSHPGALDWKRNGGHAATKDKPTNWFGVVTDTGKSSGNPVIQGKNDPFPGFYVSSTSLADKTKQRSDPRRYVDARQIPYVAFNYQVYAESGGRFTRVSKGPTGRLGDILTVVNPKADDSHKYLHAIFADVGGSDSPHFGEGSPALGLRIKAYGRVNAEIFYICYPHSGADQGTIPTFDEIQTKGEKLFKDWGGMDEVNRVLKAMPK